MSPNRVAILLAGLIISVPILAATAPAAERCVLAELFSSCT
jgi:hypothetical protein